MKRDSARPKSALPETVGKRPVSAVKTTLPLAAEAERNIKSAMPTNPSQKSLKQSQSSNKLPPTIKIPNDQIPPINKRDLVDPKQLFMNLSPTFRLAQPFTSKTDISQRFWNDANDRATGLAPNPLNRPQSGTQPQMKRVSSANIQKLKPDPYDFDTLRQENNDEDPSSGSKQFGFLSNIGGKSTTLGEITGEIPKNPRPQSGIMLSREPVPSSTPGDISVFFNCNVDKSEKTTSAVRKVQRPHTVSTGSLLTKTDSAPKSSNRFIMRPITSTASLPPQISQPGRPVTAQPGMTKTFSGQLRALSGNRGISGLLLSPSSIKKEDDIKTVQDMEYQDDDLGIQEDVEDDDDVYKKMETAQNLRRDITKFSLRPISGRTQAPEEFFATFSKFTNFAEIENRYEELFDRNERTFAATFAKFGDLSYYSPVQRIGAFMQFSAKLKLEHLKEIVTLIQTSKYIELLLSLQFTMSKRVKMKFQFKWQLLMSLIPFRIDQSNQLLIYYQLYRTGVSSAFMPEDLAREPLTLCLYPEYIEPRPDDSDATNDDGIPQREETAHQKAARLYFNDLMKTMNGVYDPEYLGKKNVVYIPPEQYPKAIAERVKLSYKRLKNYITSDEYIKPEEISKFKKDWISNALSLIPEPLLKRFEENVRRMFQEIFEDYKYSIKEAIVNYILYCPQERKRLNIPLLVRSYPSSSERIYLEGGFSVRLYPDWHEFVTHGRENMVKRLRVTSIVNSAILDWSEDFSHFRLWESETLVTCSKKGYALDIPQLKKVQDTFREKTVKIIQHIYYRGIILICKKAKYFRRKSDGKGKWTLNGFKLTSGYDQSLDSIDYGEAGNEEEQNTIEENIIYSLVNSNCQFEKGFDYFADVTRIEQLQDIRDSPAYKVYSVLADHPLNFDENIYKALPKTERKLLRASVGVEASLFLRKIIERSVIDFKNFFCKTRKLREIEAQLKRRLVGREEYDPHEDKQSKFLMHIPINSDATAVPPLSNSTSHFQSQPQQVAVLLESDYFIQPYFMNYQKLLFPILRIEMIYDDGDLKFKETEEFIESEISGLFYKVLSAFDSILHPEYTKMEVKSDLNAEKESTKRTNETGEEIVNAKIITEKIFFSHDSHEIYSRFCSLINMMEKVPKAKPHIFNLDEDSDDENKIPKFLKVCHDQEDFFQNTLKETIEHVLSHFSEAEQSFQIFTQFKPFFIRQVDKEIRDLFGRKFSFDDHRKYIHGLKNYEKILDSIPDEIFFPLFEIDTTRVKQYLANIIDDFKLKIFNKLETYIIDQLRGISNRYTEIVGFIRKSTLTPEDVENMEKFIYDLNSEKVSLKNKSSDTFRILLALLRMEFYLSSDLLFTLGKEIHEWPALLERELRSADDKHAGERAKLEDQLKERRTAFEKRVDYFAEEIGHYENFTEYKNYKKYIEEIEEFNNALEEGQKELDEINDHETKLFGIISPFETFLQVRKRLAPHADMWRTIGDFLDSKRGYMSGPFLKVDPPEVESNLKVHIRSSARLSKIFDANNALANRIITEFREDVLETNQLLPVIEVICNPGLRERHWMKIESAIGAKFNPQEGTLKEILAKEVQNHIQEIQELSEQASKEFKLESMLEKMEKEWEHMNLVVTKWKNSGVSILQGSAIEDIMVVLDDHTIKAQTIRNNPSIRFMEQRAIRWERLMLFLQEVLDLWIKVQSSYLYLEPIFGSEDITKQMPTEAKKFAEVNATWADIMRYVEIDPLVLSLENIPDLSSRLNSSLKLIDQIQKGLNDYLETKRIAFPRFFFLSNEDLLNILAETKDPLLVQPHLKKCFEGINELIFSQTVEIMGMKSSEKEEIMFLEKILPRDYKSNVELWLLKVEEQMRKSLRRVAEDSLSDSMNKKTKRTDWVRKWPGQIVICISQTVWTATVEDRLLKSGIDGIKQYDEELKHQLEDIVALVRGELTILERETLGALVVIEVHARDVVHQLVEDGVTEKESFEWLAQMRYYYDSEESITNVEMITTKMNYGYEYLGNTGRLVITPLTDRCYRTLMSALQLNLGGAPEGPAGTGKTETTKDLAKALAMQCVVFNCSEGLNAHSMAKFFKGLASAGAWSCFDEFNRIELEVLSVIAQQILRIQQAKALGKTAFQFEGTDNLALKETCNVFITMNPGYAGRSELPDNLKALFRPVAMMVPDYAMIAEISLYSYGFDQARALAKKIVATYKLCSEQLSSQAHYDYGMRAVKAVLTTAGQLKRKFAQEREDVLMLRSISDVNLPKFLTQDIQLFTGIISDLFPGVKPPVIDYGVLNDTITNAINKFKLQNIAYFRKKVYQLYEMLNSRHGVMLVGQPFSGKTMCYRVLAQALTDASGHDESNEVATHYYVINPKSVTIPQIYGYSDPISKEWTEGVLAEIFRRSATANTPDRQWIVFDGPVDADWIENMNTVLDDNKKLCLMNGETIAMSNSMTMLFETADLLQASPATVSRCGMIYLQPDNIGWWPLVQSWTLQFNDLYDPVVVKHLEDLYDGIAGKCLEFVKSKCQEWQNSPDSNSIVSMTRIMQSLMSECGLINKDVTISLKPDDIIIRIDQIFMFSLLWSLGSGILQSGKKNFDTFVKKLVAESIRCDNRKDRLFKLDKAILPPDNPTNTFQDYFLDNFKWRSWRELLDKADSEEINEKMPLYDFVVPTLDSIRSLYFLKLSIDHQIPFLTIGPTGTGKSLFINNHLKGLSLENFLLIKVTFSAKTSANQTQRIIDDKLEKVRKGVFGPGYGKKCLIFIDDLNMPALDKYGAQPPLELIRQYFDHKGWYDLKDRRMREIVETTILAAMGPPGGGRNTITSRLLRHFYLFATNESDDKILQRIFGKIIDLHIQRNQLDSEPARVLRLSVEGSTEIYLQIVQNLKPTPAKSHYLFNLRDLSRVVQGMLLLPKDQISDTKRIVRSWMHEICRVFYDRLITDSDQEWFFTTLIATTKGKLRENDLKAVFKEILEDKTSSINVNSPDILKYLRFGTVLSEELDAQSRPYTEVTNFSLIQQKAVQYLEQYNLQTKKPMNLILFEFAIDHMLRICRILKMSRSHALLVGLGGRGRQSLTRLSAFICDHEVFTVEVSKSYNFEQWRNDLQRLIISAGTENKYYVFLMTDSQLKETYILEDINNLLNSADVPNLLSQDEFVPLIDKLRIKAKQEDREDLYSFGTNAQYYDYFIENVRAHLHVVLVLSSIGTSMRTKIRMFPSLVNCCTLIWYKPWPEEALQAVAQTFISQMGVDSSTQNGMAAVCKYMHESVKRLTDDYLKNEGRYVYVTPTSYLDLLSSLNGLLTLTRNKLTAKRDSYTQGVEKLEETAIEVGKMQQDLTDKQPKLQVMKAQTAELAASIANQVKEMEPIKIAVEKEEEIVNQRFQEAEVIRNDCQRELDKALPLVEKAKKALQNIDPNDIINLKAMLKPPNTVRLVMEAVCVLLQKPPILIPNPENPKEKIQSYWEASKKVLGDKNFIEMLLGYNIDAIDPGLMTRIRDHYLSNTAEFNPQRVEKASSAAKGLCEWVIALSKYEKVLVVVRPKQEQYDRSCKEVEDLKKALKKKTDELNELKRKIGVLQKEYEETITKEKELENDILICEKKLDRASTLINSLAGEKVRWTESATELTSKTRFIIGDVLLSAGTISYLGPFNSVYRGKIQKEWITAVKGNDILVSDNYSLENILGEQIVIRKWVINGLPSDSFSKENGIMIDKGGRYPLLIDPQSQANKWIKNNEMENNLKVVKQTDSDFVRNLENSVQFGWVLLIENVQENLDPILEPVLMKQTFKHSGTWSIKIGENIVEFNKTFRIYITTKMRNPHYLPEVSTKINLVNFMITKEGLDDQLLEIAVNKEKPDLEEMRSKLIVQSHENKVQLEDIENKILKILKSSKGNILDDEEAITVLSQSKQIAMEIEEKQIAAEVTEKKIEEARTGYKPIAQHSRVLFFAIMSLSNIEVVYQYSLSWFINLYLSAFEQAEASEFILQRVNNVISFFTYSVYTNVCRSLFEKDKLLFSFVLTTSILESKGQIDPSEYQYFISPPSGAGTLESPLKWLTNYSWNKIKELAHINDYFAKLPFSFTENSEKWEKIYDSQDAHKMPFPEPFMAATHMQRLCILKAIRPDRVIGGIREFIIQQMGANFITPPAFDLQKSFAEAEKIQRLIFILPGTDPMSLLLHFAEQHKIKGDSLQIISLGQGQGVWAEKAIEDYKKNPAWVILQNCHLAPSWMPKLEKICEFLDSKAGKETTHPSFRLWLTTYSSEDFPSSILQSSVKMTNEPPKGLKNNMLVSYTSDPINNLTDFYEANQKPKEFKNLMFGLCMFHAVIQERRTYGPLGWNIRYDFNQSDLRISVRQLYHFLNTYKGTPLKALHYLIGECNYGGRVTDDKDRRILKALMLDFFAEKTMQVGYNYMDLKEFYLPDTSSYDKVLKHLDGMSVIAPPELFGFHSNAEISRDLKDTNEMTHNLLLISGGTQSKSKEGESDETKLKKICEDITSKLPKEYNTEIVTVKYPITYNNSMNTVLGQEIVRYNILISTIANSLKNVELALIGQQVMSEELEETTRTLLRGLVPETWKKRSYPSLKPLASYMLDLYARLAYFQKWIDTGYPQVFWISGFYFTQSFLTGILQNYARKFTISIDKLIFDFEFLDEPNDPAHLDQLYKSPEDGAYIFGLYLEGARWDYHGKKLDESQLKVLYTSAPIMWLKPIDSADMRDIPHYKCPVYKTMERKGTLSTTGHSTNFIMMVNMDSEVPESHWIKRGVAMICQLSE